MKKVLLAVNGSDASLRAVRHVGEILSGRDGFEVTLFHVCAVPPRLLEHEGAEDPDEERRLEEALEAECRAWREAKHAEVERQIFAQALGELRAAGIDEERTPVSTRFVTEAHADVAAEILQEQHEHGHDVIALGREDLSTLRELVFGSVASRVVHHGKGRAIWLVE
jgi:nucleotide-binding universal stress UspA family protein